MIHQQIYGFICLLCVYSLLNSHQNRFLQSFKTELIYARDVSPTVAYLDHKVNKCILDNIKQRGII